jgi:hypothetical protein
MHLFRSGLYDAEIRKLEITKNSPQFDFKQLFLVKESLALMYQMMQLPGEALAQYEEMELLLHSFAPVSLPESNWPLFATNTNSSSSSKGGGASGNERAPETDGGNSGDPPSSGGAAVAQSLDKDIRGLWYEPAFQGDAVLTYSINHARMRVLKNKIGVLEMCHYVFARQCFFYFGLGRASLCAEKALTFVTFADTNLKRRVESGALMRSTQLDAVAATGEAIKLDAKTLMAMIDLWVVTAVVRIARSYREHFNELNRAASSNRSDSDDVHSGGYVPTLSSEFSTQNIGGSTIQLSQGASTGGVSAAAASVAGTGKSFGNKDSSRALCNLLQMSYSRLMNSLMTKEQSSLLSHRKRALEMSMALTSWEDLHKIREKYPVIFGAFSDTPASPGQEGSVGAAVSKGGPEQLDKLDNVSLANVSCSVILIIFIVFIAGIRNIFKDSSPHDAG